MLNLPGATFALFFLCAAETSGCLQVIDTQQSWIIFPILIAG